MTSCRRLRPTEVEGGFGTVRRGAFGARAALCLFLAAFLLPAVKPAWAGVAKPYVPDSPDVVLQRVPTSTDPRVRHFEQLRGRLQAHPGDMKLALKLAKAYIGYGRSTGNARFLGRSLAVIAPWMKPAPPPVPIALVHATVLQSRHHFSASRRELNKILARGPGNAQAWLTLATVEMVQADYPAANKACVHLARITGNFLSIMCTAQLRTLTGHAEQAYALLKMIAHPGPEAPAGVKAYVQGLLADTAKRLGRDKKADRHYRRGLQLTPGDNFLLADYGDFLLHHGRPRAAAELVKNYTASDTSFMRLVFAETALGSPKTEHDIAEMTARFAAMEQRGTHVYRREQARFVLYLKHDPERALNLAKKNWTVQRAPKDMRILLAAALAAGKPAAARPVLERLAQSHLQDPPVNRLAGKVRAALDGNAKVAMQREDSQ